MREPKTILQTRYDELTARTDDEDEARTDTEKLIAGIRRDEVITLAVFFGVLFTGQGRAFEIGEGA